MSDKTVEGRSRKNYKCVNKEDMVQATREEPGEARRSQKAPRRSQGSQGRAKGGARRSQEEPGGARKSHEEPAGARRSQEEARTKEKNSYLHFTFC